MPSAKSVKPTKKTNSRVSKPRKTLKAGISSKISHKAKTKVQSAIDTIDIDTVEILKQAEEQRLKLGNKIESSYIKTFKRIKSFVAQAFESPSLGILIALLIAVFAVGDQIKSYPFVGHEIFRKEGLYFIIGILSVLSSALILMKAPIDRKVYNLLIISFGLSFFFQAHSPIYGRYSFNSSFALALLYPYFSYQITSQYTSSILRSLMIGVLAAALFCLNPFFAVIILTFEVFKLVYQTTDILNDARANRVHSPLVESLVTNLVTLVLIGALLVGLSLNIFPSKFGFMIANSVGYDLANVYLSNFSIIDTLEKDLFPVLLLVLITAFSVKGFLKQRINRSTVILAASACIMLGLQLSYSLFGYEQKLIFYSLCFPAVAVIFYQIFSKHTDWKKYFWIVLAFFIIPQFDSDIYGTLAIIAVYFSPLLFALLAFSTRSKFPTITASLSFISLISFALFFLSLFSLEALRKIVEIDTGRNMWNIWATQYYVWWMVLASIFCFMIVFFELLPSAANNKKLAVHKFNMLSTVTNAVMLSYFFYLMI